ncbi:MAG: McrB family protein [Cetobacterium sp.]|uniref:McrB family protein n=1 Tax=Cetobacterium sp. TaxID=2071632 RepID=UPI003F3F11E3
MREKYIYHFNSQEEFDLFSQSNVFILPKKSKEKIKDIIYISLYDKNSKKFNLKLKGTISKILSKKIFSYNFIPSSVKDKENLKEYILSIPFPLIENFLNFTSINNIIISNEDKNEIKELIKLKKILENLILENKINLKKSENIYFTTEKSIQLIKGEAFKENIKNINYLLKNIFLCNSKENIVVENLIAIEDQKKEFPYKNLIFYGPPGTGKTTLALKESLNILKDMELSTIDDFIKEEQLEICSFHQSYSYEDFIEGLTSDSKGNFVIKNGIFKNFVLKAKNNLEKNFVIILDEINRGDISKIFGEIITLIEEDKREGEKNSLTITLPYSQEKFSIPNNLYIIGTMNNSDRSISSFDLALRRRFLFKEIEPIYDNLPIIENIDLKKLLEVMNKRIEVLYDRQHLIGQSYFLNLSSFEDLKITFIHKIIPLLQEYFLNDLEKVGLILGGIGTNSQENFFVYQENINISKLFKRGMEDFQENINILYKLNPNISIGTFLNIYE